jgi:hypothetical protein
VSNVNLQLWSRDTDRRPAPEQVPLHYVLGQYDFAIGVEPSVDAKCGRCWRLLPDVSEDGALCHRCEDVVAQLDAVP